jgi:hypothetical protein
VKMGEGFSTLRSVQTSVQAELYTRRWARNVARFRVFKQVRRHMDVKMGVEYSTLRSVQTSVQAERYT